MRVITQPLKKYKYKKEQLKIEDCLLIAPNTRLAYTKGWNCFQDYCFAIGQRSLPAKRQVVTQFLINQSSHLSTGSLELYLSSINKMHVINGYPSFNSYLDIRGTMKNLARCDWRPIRRVRALLGADLQAIFEKIPSTLLGIRDGAVLAVGFAAALRRSEICQLRFEDIEFVESRGGQKMLLNIRRSKTDQAGRGYKIGIIDGQRIKPITRLKNWLDSSSVKSGYLFRTMQKGGQIKTKPLHHSDIARLVKQYAASINLNPSDYSGHSLRSGFITSAAIHRARIDKIMEVSRHKSTDMVMSYIRDSNIFDDHAGKSFL